MNSHQEVWWNQARSDHVALVLLRRQGANPCHQLHYLQMVTEKLGKAYFWRSGSPPPKSHAGFVQFLRSLGATPQAKRQVLADILEFKNFAVLQAWLRVILPLAYQLERLAPALSMDGPNPEYPWPQNLPIYSPARYQFPIWGKLNTGRGRELLKVIRIAVERFPAYG